MNEDSVPMTRQQRESQLMEMWGDSQGKLTVLQLFREAMPLGETPPSGKTVIDVILDFEFGKSSDRREYGKLLGSGSQRRRIGRTPGIDEPKQIARTAMDAKVPARKACSETWSVSDYHAALSVLQQAMDSMYGHANSALLGDIHQIAQSKFGFKGTISDAFVALQTAPQLRLNPADPLEQARVYFPQQSE